MKSYRTLARRLALPLALAFALALVVSACGGGTKTAGGGGSSSTASAESSGGNSEGAEGGSEPVKGGAITVSGGPVPTLDPAAGSANAMALAGNAIYETLMKVVEPGEEPQPNIAESMTESNGGMTWTMKVPTGLKFSDGTPFNAEAVVFNMERDMEPTSSAAALLSSVKSVSAPNPTTVVFKMSEPLSSLPYALSYDGSGTAGYMASPTAVKKYGKDYSAHASGLGPFMVQSWSATGKTVLVQNPNYWNAEEEPVYLEKVTVESIPSETTAYQSVQAGNLTLMGSANPSTLSQAQSNGNVKTVMGETENNQDSIILNMATKPFENLELREAVSMALNREEIAQLTTSELGGPAVNLFPEGNPYHDEYTDPEFDVEKAKEIVTSYKEKTGETPSFTYTCNTERPATEVIVHQLQEAGFNVKLNAEEVNAWLADFFGKKYQAICWTMAPFLSPDQLPYRFFYSKGDLNTGGYASKAFDTAANEARSATGEEKKADWQKADKVLTEELPWVWTTTGPIGFIMSPKLEGVEWEQPYRQRYYVPTFAHSWLSE
jgi:peptide/nickel transport system substrate-binding protein